MSNTDLLNDRKLCYWSLCEFYFDCYIYVRGTSITTHHKNKSGIQAALYRSSLADFMAFMALLYRPEYVTKNMIRVYNALTGTGMI